jgi:hypothetical protein
MVMRNTMLSLSHALVKWKTFYRPKSLGGLGIPDLKHSGHALRLRWLWLQWTNPLRPWSASKLPINNTDMALFRASMKITLGNGESAKRHLSGTTSGVIVALSIF